MRTQIKNRKREITMKNTILITAKFLYIIFICLTLTIGLNAMLSRIADFLWEAIPSIVKKFKAKKKKTK
jgi:hypothetical protein